MFKWENWSVDLQSFIDENFLYQNSISGEMRVLSTLQNIQIFCQHVSTAWKKPKSLFIKNTFSKIKITLNLFSDVLGLHEPIGTKTES